MCVCVARVVRVRFLPEFRAEFRAEFRHFRAEFRPEFRGGAACGGVWASGVSGDDESARRATCLDHAVKGRARAPLPTHLGGSARPGGGSAGSGQTDVTEKRLPCAATTQTDAKCMSTARHAQIAVKTRVKRPHGARDRRNGNPRTRPRTRTGAVDQQTKQTPRHHSMTSPTHVHTQETCVATRVRTCTGKQVIQRRDHSPPTCTCAVDKHAKQTPPHPSLTSDTQTTLQDALKTDIFERLFAIVTWARLQTNRLYNATYACCHTRRRSFVCGVTSRVGRHCCVVCVCLFGMRARQDEEPRDENGFNGACLPSSWRHARVVQLDDDCLAGKLALIALLPASCRVVGACRLMARGVFVASAAGAVSCRRACGVWWRCLTTRAYRNRLSHECNDGSQAKEARICGEVRVECGLCWIRAVWSARVCRSLVVRCRVHHLRMCHIE